MGERGIQEVLYNLSKDIRHDYVEITLIDTHTTNITADTYRQILKYYPLICTYAQETTFSLYSRNESCFGLMVLIYFLKEDKVLELCM